MDWAEVKEDLVQGKDINLTYSVTFDDVSYDMTGYQLDMKVIDQNGDIVKTWSTAGGSPVLSISTSSFTITDTIGFLNWGFYRGELIDNTNDRTIAFFDFTVAKQITAP